MNKRIIIIPSDGFVSVDGVVCEGIDTSTIGDDIHCVQWYNSYGEVEYSMNDQGVKPQNQRIDDISFCDEIISEYELKLNQPEEPEEPEEFIQTTYSVLEFRDKFTLEEQINIRHAQFTDMEVGLVYDNFQAAQYIDLDDTRVEQGLSLYVSKGLLTEERKVEIMTVT